MNIAKRKAMSLRKLVSACGLATLVSFASNPSMADQNQNHQPDGNSSFQLTCSQIEFAFIGQTPSVTAVCLKKDGSLNASKLTLSGISNNNGHLVQGTGLSTFQKSCGNIHLDIQRSSVDLVAFCRTISGQFKQTSLPLNISNKDGVLSSP